jgi:hypothetical protein
MQKLAVECQDLIQKPLKNFSKRYRKSSREILYAIRKLECFLSAEAQKANSLAKHPQLATSEAIAEKYTLQMEKCTDLLRETNLKVAELFAQFKSLEHERITTLRQLLWTFHQLLTPFVPATAFTEFRKTLIANEQSNSLEEIDKHYQPLTLEGVVQVHKRSASRFYLRSIIREILIS